MTIGERIRNRRIELGMSQEDLAIRAGYKSKTSVNKIELMRDVPLNRVRPIAEALECTPEYLLGWQQGEEEPSPRAKRYANMIMRLRPEQRMAVEAVIDAMLSESDKL